MRDPRPMMFDVCADSVGVANDHSFTRDSTTVLAAHVHRGHARRSVEIAIKSLGEPRLTGRCGIEVGCSLERARRALVAESPRDPGGLPPNVACS